jgi:hypothetical protein
MSSFSASVARAVCICAVIDADRAVHILISEVRRAPPARPGGGFSVLQVTVF